MSLDCLIDTYIRTKANKKLIHRENVALIALADSILIENIDLVNIQW